MKAWQVAIFISSLFLISCSNLLEPSNGRDPKDTPLIASGAEPEAEGTGQSSGGSEDPSVETPLLGNLVANPNSTIAFGSVSVGSPVGKQLTLSNSGPGDITSITVALTNAAGVFSVVSDGCSNLSQMASTQTCVVSLRMTSLSSTPSGSVNGSLVVNYATGTEERTVTISLTGTVPGSGSTGGTLSVNVSTTTLNFSNVVVPGSATRSFDIINEGTVTVSPSVSPVEAPFSIVGNNCPSYLVGGASCQITVKFTPTTGGTRTATLTVVVPLGPGVTLTMPVNLTGVGVPD